MLPGLFPPYPCHAESSREAQQRSQGDHDGSYGGNAMAKVEIDELNVERGRTHEDGSSDGGGGST